MSMKPARGDSFKENRKVQLNNRELKASCAKVTARLVPDSKPPTGRPLNSANPYRAEISHRFTTATFYYKGLLKTTQNNTKTSRDRIITHNVN